MLRIGLPDATSKRFNNFLDWPSRLLLALEARFWRVSRTIAGTATVFKGPKFVETISDRIVAVSLPSGMCRAISDA
jgi:hypothetical protein